MRINKFLAKADIASRRQAEELVIAGLVKKNGKTVTDLSEDVNVEEDIITVRNIQVTLQTEKIYIMMNKPKGYLVTARDDFNRKTVFELLPDFGGRIFSIGRLDYQSEGLLLLTNDGDFANRVIHPKFKLPKIYKVKCSGYLKEDQIAKLRNGVIFDGKKTMPAKVFVKARSATSTVLRMTIFEGRKRQIRRMLKCVGSEVSELKRLQIGKVSLNKLSVGMWRYLEPREIEALWKYKR